MSDLIDRQAAFEALDAIASELHERKRLDEEYIASWCAEVIEGLPTTEPDDAALHESCTDCPLYEHDRHRCPRFNRVIPTTIQEILDTQTQRWIPVAERLPVEGESVLLCNSYGDMTLGRLVRTNEGCNWDIYAWWCDIYDWVAWMPLPEPWEGES